MAYELDMGKMAIDNLPAQQRAMLEGMKMSFNLTHTAIEADPVFSGNDFTFTPGEGVKLVEEFDESDKYARMIGNPALDFILPDLDGKLVKLADFAGKVVILDFWATWCPPCVEEIPAFCELYQAYKDKGLVIVGISLDRDGVEVVREFAAKHKVPYPLVMGDQKVTEAYGGISAIPTTFIIDRQGKLVDGVVGGRPKAYFEGKISSLF